MARRLPPARVALAPVTLGRYVAARASLCEGERTDAGEAMDWRTLPDVDLVGFCDAVLSDPPARYGDRAALVATVLEARAAWEDAVEQAFGLALTRAGLIADHVGGGWSRATDGEPPPPIEALVADFALAEWAAVRDLPLWEVFLVRAGADVLGRFRRFVSPPTE